MSRLARSSVAVGRVAAVAATVALGAGVLGGCSLVSGWSDLQTGAKDAGSTKPGADGSSGNPGGGVNGEAGAPGTTDDDGGGTSSGVVCASNVCAPGEGCCVAFDGPKTCSKASQCDTSGGSFFLSCTSAASCDARSPTCCFDYGSLTSSCMTACKPGYPPICDAPPNTCPSGQMCTSTIAEVGNIRACK